MCRMRLESGKSPKPLSTIVIEPTNWKWDKTNNNTTFTLEMLLLEHCKSPAHWFDKFPSAGNELNRGKTKDYLAAEIKKKKSSYMPLCSEMIFLAFHFCFACASNFLLFSIFSNVLSHTHTHTEQCLTREARNYLWWLRNCALLTFYFILVCCPFARATLVMIPLCQIPFPAIRIILSHCLLCFRIPCILFIASVMPKSLAKRQRTSFEMMTLKHAFWHGIYSLNGIFCHINGIKLQVPNFAFHHLHTDTIDIN